MWVPPTVGGTSKSMIVRFLCFCIFGSKITHSKLFVVSTPSDLRFTSSPSQHRIVLFSEVDMESRIALRLFLITEIWFCKVWCAGWNSPKPGGIRSSTGAEVKVTGITTQALIGKVRYSFGGASCTCNARHVASRASNARIKWACVASRNAKHVSSTKHWLTSRSLVKCMNNLVFLLKIRRRFSKVWNHLFQQWFDTIVAWRRDLVVVPHRWIMSVSCVWWAQTRAAVGL